MSTFVVLDGPLDGVDRVLEVDEDFTHPFRLTALVCLRQCIRNVATLFYLTVPGGNQLFASLRRFTILGAPIKVTKKHDRSTVGEPSLGISMSL